MPREGLAVGRDGRRAIQRASGAWQEARRAGRSVRGDARALRAVMEGAAAPLLNRGERRDGPRSPSRPGPG